MNDVYLQQEAQFHYEVEGLRAVELEGVRWLASDSRATVISHHGPETVARCYATSSHMPLFHDQQTEEAGRRAKATKLLCQSRTQRWRARLRSRFRIWIMVA